MNMIQQIQYYNKNYTILHAEQEFVVHPSAFGLLPMTKASMQCSFSSDFHIKDYHLILDNITLTNDETNSDNIEKQFDFKECNVAYSGAVLIAANLVKEYYIKGAKPACFSYQNVYELIFEDGMLKTTIDQSKAMLRIRKNLELGLRSLNNGRDLRCIKRFVNSSLVGDYKLSMISYNRLKYLKEMKRKYANVNLHSVSTVFIEG